MKVVHVSLFYDEKLNSEEELIEQHYTITGWAEALQRKGVEVTVISRFSRESSFQKNGVQYYFIKDHLGGILTMRHLPLKFLRRISRLGADVIHLHNLSLSLQTFFLRKMLNKKTAIIIQHHGGVMPGKMKRRFYNLLNSVADGFYFTTTEQGQEWFMKKRKCKKIMPVMEGGTFFNFPERDTNRINKYYDRSLARKNTALHGNPVFLWVGRLDDNKDPLTVLGGFEILFNKYPEANLYMIYSDNKLYNAVADKINHSEILKTRVRLLGAIAHNEIEMYYNSADYFVVGSHYEGSGYALSEALRCGCIPVVTNIPSFRMMTNNGQSGTLWEPGNSNSFVEAAQAAINKPIEAEARACIDFFNRNLSFDAIAETAIQHYQAVMTSLAEKE